MPGFTKIPQPQGPLEVSTVFVDNFVDKGILTPGKHPNSSWHGRKPGENSNLISFKINYLEKAC